MTAEMENQIPIDLEQQTTSHANVEVLEDTASKSQETVRVEEFKISGGELVAKVKELLHQGNIRRIS